MRLEELETRLVPAQFVWSGKGSLPIMSDPNNWVGKVAPTGVASNQEDLVFDSNGVSQPIVRNDMGNPTFHSITFGASGYQINNDPTKGALFIIGTANGGTITVQPTFSDTITLPLRLNGALTSQVTVFVDSTAKLTLNGTSSLDQTNGSLVGLIKDGVGTLLLQSNDQGFNGPITVKAGILEMATTTALGSTAPTNVTTVQANAQLRVDPLPGTTPIVGNNLILNGPGITNDGALLNLGTNNTFAGTIELDSDTTIGSGTSSSGSADTLFVLGVISDNATGHNLTKEGQGRVFLEAADTYRGTTTINNGILEINNGLALGTGQGAAQDGVTVNSTINEQGTLQLTGGITVTNKLLTLNGKGPNINPIGALDSLTGQNVWTGNVTLGSPSPNGSNVTIADHGAFSPANTLTITGIISQSVSAPFGGFLLTKTGTGTVIFTNANTYAESTLINQGILETTNSLGLGPAIDSKNNNPNTVQVGSVDNFGFLINPASLELDGSNTNPLNVPNPLVLNGSGVNNLGALYNHTGINIYSGSVTLETASTIGVDPDPNPTADKTYLTSNYSLTISGALNDNTTNPFNSIGNRTLEKVGTGQLVLQRANTNYTGPNAIFSGWVTAENSNALGNLIADTSQNNQPWVRVINGASLDLYNNGVGTGLQLPQNVDLTGNGISHPYSLINQQGAIESIGGVNSLNGNMYLDAQAGLGVEKAQSAGQLITTGPIAQARSLVQFTASGSGGEFDHIVDTGATDGSITISFTVGGTSTIDIYMGDANLTDAVHVDSRTLTGTSSFTINNYGSANGKWTQLEVIINKQTTSGAWKYTATVTPAGVNSGFNKLGSELLDIEGPGTYRGNNDIQAGVVLLQNNTGLGAGVGSTTVENGAALALGTSVTVPNGGVSSGLQIYGEKLILNGLGNSTLGTPVAALTVLTTNTITGGQATIQPTGDYLWQGPMSLGTGTDIDIQTNARLDVLGIIDDAGSATGASDLIKVGTGELMLSGVNTFRGNTYIGTSSVTDPDGVNEFLTGSATTPRPGGILTAAANQALGAANGTVIVQNGSAIQTEGNITLAGRTLIAQGTGVSSVGAPVTWFLQGPAPINNGATLGTTTGPIAGYVTGIAVDPRDNQVIYLSTASGGAWKTVNGGQTWQLVDNGLDTLYLGAIAMDPLNPQRLFLGTGVMDNSQGMTYQPGVVLPNNDPQLNGAPPPYTSSDPWDPSNVYPQAVPTNRRPSGTADLYLNDGYAGTGVFTSTDGGTTWTKLLADNGTNPWNQTAITSFAWDNLDPDSFGGQTVLYIANSDQTRNGNTLAQIGVWRYDPNVDFSVTGAQRLFNMTGTTSTNRNNSAALKTTFLLTPGNPGPDDDFRISFPQNQASWSDVAVVNGTLYAAVSSIDPVYPSILNSQNGGTNPTSGPGQPVNAVYHMPLWQEFYHVTGTSRGVYDTDNIPGLRIPYVGQYEFSNPVWFIGTGNIDNVTTDTNFSAVVGVDGEGGGYPNPFYTALSSPSGWIKLGAQQNAPRNPAWGPIVHPRPANTTVFAVAINPPSDEITGSYAQGGTIKYVQVTTNSGAAWNPINTPPPNVVGFQGWYDTAVYYDGTNLYLGGKNQLVVSPDGGGTWNDITTDGNGNAPYPDFHYITRDGIGNLYVATDGGIWKYDLTFIPTWKDLNGNLANSLVNGLATNPANPVNSLIGTQAGGLSSYNGAPGWTQDFAAPATTPLGGQVAIDPLNPNNQYGFVSNESSNPEGGYFLSGVPFQQAVDSGPTIPTATLMRSTDGGKTWISTGQVFDYTQDGVIAIDQVNPTHLLAGGIDSTNNPIQAPAQPLHPLRESLNGGANWVNLPVPTEPSLGTPTSVTAIAIAQYQGPYQFDGGFAQVLDSGANTYVGDKTFYITDGTDLWVTKNDALSWSRRTPPAGGGRIIDIEVDPRNRDTIYAVIGTQGSPGAVYMSTNAGQNWTALTSNGLGSAGSFWKLAIDPRGSGVVQTVTVNGNSGNFTLSYRGQSTTALAFNASATQVQNALNALSTINSTGGSVSVAQNGNVYAITFSGLQGFTLPLLGGAPTAGSLNLGLVIGTVPTLFLGTDAGVFSSVDAGASWQTFGTGLPPIEARELVLNQAYNTLTVGTYGRGAFEAWLNESQPNAGAITVVSGTAIWNGAVSLAGPTTIGADGTQLLQNGIATASLNIVGSISDSTPGANYALTKIGDGNVILSGGNTYGGTLEIQQGVLIGNNPSALSNSTAVVDPGTGLQLEQSITSGATLKLFGDGPTQFNGHYTGALENIGNTNIYNGPIFLLTPRVTIAADSGSQLTITGSISEQAPNTGATLVKEATGTLSLAGANFYTGQTFANEGALEIQNSSAVSNSMGVVVLDGAQVQVSDDINGNPVTVVSNSLSLSGTGINNTGALLDVGTHGNTNTWAGPISLDVNPGFTPSTTPGGVVSFGVNNANDTLALTGIISDANEASGIAKVGGGTVVLSSANTYQGTTYIYTGALRITDPNALGLQASPDIQRLVVAGTGNYTLTLAGNATTIDGTTKFTFPAADTAPFGFATTAAQIQTQINTWLKNAGVIASGSGVTVTKTTFNWTPPTETPLTGQVPYAVYTIQFTAASLAGVDMPLLAAAPSVADTFATATRVADGGIGTLIEPPSMPSLPTATLQLALNGATVTGEGLVLNGIGAPRLQRLPAPYTTTDTAQGGLSNFSGNNIWNGPIFLQSSSQIGVDSGSLNVIFPVSGPAASTITKVGQGPLTFSAADTYAGNTVVADGILDISNSSGLGLGLSNDIQTVTLTGSASSTFQLIFNGQTTSSLAFNATAAQVQSALAALPNVGAGNVSVTAATTNGVTTFTVTFIGTLAAKDQSQLTAKTSDAFLTVTIATTQHGGLGGTFVGPTINGLVSPGTLQLVNGISITTNEALTLNGPGFTTGAGALDSLSGVNNWSATSPITLAGNSSISAQAGSTLNINQTITESALGSNLTKLGAGTVTLAGSLANTWTGQTLVNSGTLLLSKPANVLAVPGSLTVGDGVSPTLVQELADGQISSTGTVRVPFNGTLDVNGHQQTIATLQLLDGTATAGPNATTGALTINSLSMAGGQLLTGKAGSQVILNGNGTATSDLVGGVSVIQGAGQFVLAGTDTLTVNPGPNAPKGTDLDIKSVISGVSNLVKAGAGRLEIDADNTTSFTGQTIDTAGDLQVDGKLNEVNLSGGTLSGVGSVGNIDNGSTGSAPNGTITPGDNGSATPVGILTTTPNGTEVWGPTTTFAPDLNNANQAAGVGYDQLIVNGGILNLGGAVLTGLVAPTVGIGDSFTVIQAVNGGQITGRFNEPFSPGVVFIGGQKFTVDYNDPTKVVISRTKEAVSVGLTSSANPSVYGQTVTFTAQLTPEQGVNLPPTGDTITFTLDGTNVTVHPDATGKASVASTQFAVTQPLTIATHVVQATFNGDSVYAVEMSPVINQQVTTAKTSITLSGGTPPVQYGQDVVINAQVSTVAPGVGIPTGSVTFSVDGTPQNSSVNLDPSGNASVDLVGLTVGKHRIQASYSGDATHSPVATTSDYLVTILAAPSTVTISDQPTSSVHNQSVNFTAVVSPVPPNTLIPTGTVNFFDGSVATGRLIGTTQIDSTGTGSISISTLSTATHTITVQYVGDTNFTGSTNSLSLTVGQDSTSTTLTQQSNLTVYGDAAIFTATVSNTSAGSGVPNGTVTFTIDSTTQTVGLDSTGKATYTTASLTVGPHTISAVYNGSTDFIGSSAAAISHIVRSFTTTTVTLPPTTVYGQTANFSAAVVGTAPGSGTPTGAVQFVVDGDLAHAATVVLDNTGHAVFSTNTLGAGTHTIKANYSGDPTYIPSSTASALNYSVNQANTTTTLSLSSSSGVFGQPAVFTATIAANSPSMAVPDGAATFIVDGVSQTPTPLDASGKAALTLSSLAVGTHRIAVSYPSDANFTGSSTQLPSVYTVTAASTAIGLTTSLNPAPFGHVVAFTATVTANGPSTAIPNGQVTFTVDANTPNQVSQAATLDATGKATLNVSNLSVGNHTVSATYQGNASFGASGPTNTITEQIVSSGPTTTTLTTSDNPAVYGEPVVFTATVTPNVSNAIPDGTVTFSVDGSSTVIALDATGKATLTLSNLGLGNHSVQATYSGSPGFGGSTSSTLTETINQVGTNTTLTSSANPSVWGQNVTFTAQVAANNPSIAVPPGSVIFTVDGTQSSVALDAGGKATVTLTSPSVGNHTVSVSYAGNTNFGGSAAGPVTQVVNAATTTTTLTSTQNPAVYGQPFTLTALVAASGTSAVPTGSVTFTIDGGTSVVNLDSTGKATLVFNDRSNPSSQNMDVGAHTISASYTANTNFGGSASGNQTETVNQATTTTSVASSANPAVFGSPVTFTATVAASNPSTAIPKGSVVFTIDGTSSGPVALDSTGKAQFVANSLSKGSHTVSVSYAATTDFAGSSGNLTENVQSGSTVTISALPTSATFGQTVTFKATVAAQSPATGTPTGTVQFIIDGVKMAPVGVANGVATFSTNTLSAGTHSIQAVYSGDTTFVPSQSSTAFTVSPGSTTITASTSAGVSAYGQAVTFTANVAANLPAVGTPTGKVVFIVDGTAVATVSMVNGQASYTTSTLSIGLHNVIVVYLGDSNFLASNNTSNLLFQQITSPPASSLSASLLASNIQANTPFSIEIQALDAFGNQATFFSGPWALTVLSAPVGGTLSVTAATQFTGGVAFANLLATRPGQYVVQISTGGLFTDLTINVGGRGQ